jgi:chemotaxis protein methyltransferase CheR
MPTEVSNATTLAPSGKQEAQDPVFLRIRDLVYQTCGIYHSDEKLYLLVAACQRRMAADTVKATDTKGYLALLTGTGSKRWETRELLNEITIGETCLFRSLPQINALKNVILPELLAERSKTGPKKLKVWSAGCSTGEEPHTLSMLFLEEKEELLRDWNFEIQATDLNDRAIEAARAGVYGEYALRNTPEMYKRKYFTPVENGRLKVKDEVKARVTFTRLNLTDESRMASMKGMDIIFCCNVLIYFDAASKKRVVQHYFSNLVPGGSFFLGHAESLYQVNDQFRLVHLPGTTVYRKPGADGR